MIVNEEVNRYPQQVVITRDDTGETILHLRRHPRGQQDRRGHPGCGPARGDLRV